MDEFDILDRLELTIDCESDRVLIIELRKLITEKNEFIDAAFCAHPNLDLDIESLK